MRTVPVRLDLKQSPDDEAEKAANAVLRYLRHCGFSSEKEKQDWLAKVFELVNEKGFFDGQSLPRRVF